MNRSNRSSYYNFSKMKRTRPVAERRAQLAEEKRNKTINNILSTLMLVVQHSNNINFQTRCFAELGTNDMEEINNILRDKLQSAFTK